MDAYDRCTNLAEKILPMVLPSMVETENFSEHPRIGKETSEVKFKTMSHR
jgi:hypothetical protein